METKVGRGINMYKRDVKTYMTYLKSCEKFGLAGTCLLDELVLRDKIGE